MKAPRRRGIALGGLLVLLGAALAGAQTARPPFAILVDQLLGFFPKVIGDAVEVQGHRVTVSLGRRDGLQAGVELELFREGRELRHPRTGQVLGRTEEALGRASVGQVFEAYAVANLLSGAKVQPGDRVRVPGGKIRLTLLTLPAASGDAQVEAAIQELADEIGRTGRFELVSGDAIAVRLGQQGIRPEEAIEGKGLAAALKGASATPYVLAVLFKRVQGKRYMEVRLLSDVGAAPLLTTALFVPRPLRTEAQFSANPRARSSPPAPQRSLLARLLGGEIESGAYSSGESSIPLKEIGRLGFPVLAMDVAVSPKDHLPRLVVSDGDKIHGYRIVEQRLEPEWTFSEAAIGRVISLQLADLDGDGVLEVVGNRWDVKAGLNSFVLGTAEGKPKYLADSISSILIAVDAKGTGVKQTLWAQRFSPEQFFTRGQADEMVLRDGRLTVERVVRVPSMFRATGAAYGNFLAKDRRALVFIDEFNHLQVAAGGEEVWQSSTAVGGGYATVELFRQLDSAGRSYFYKMEPNLLAVDLDGDGVDELVVPMNVVKEGLIGVIFRGPAGFRLQTVNSGFEGGISGLGAFKLDEGDPPTLVAAVLRRKASLLTKALQVVSGETQIIMTVPPE